LTALCPSRHGSTEPINTIITSADDSTTVINVTVTAEQQMTVDNMTVISVTVTAEQRMTA